MRIFFLDVASHQGLVACVTPERVAASVSIDHRIDDRHFVTSIESLLGEAKWSYESLTHIACIVGPGGFTSLRVGVASANALASTLGIPSKGIHMSEMYAARIRDGEMAGWWIHSTKKQEVFLRGFGAHENLVPEPTWMKLDDAFQLLKPGDRWMGELIPEQRKVVEDRGVIEAPLQSLEVILPSFLSSQTYEKKLLLPWYGREW